MFHVGQMVVSINDFTSVAGRHSRLPKKGEVFTIRDIHDHRKGLGLCLEESIGKPCPEFNCSDWCFAAEYFCPVRPTSIELFRQIVASPKVTNDA